MTVNFSAMRERFSCRTMKTVTIPLIWICTFIVCTSSITIIEVPTEITRRIVCYYTFPSSLYNLQPENIEPNLCTHILVGFSTVENNSIQISTDEENLIRKVIKLKTKNADLKVMLSLGGGDAEYGFPEMVQNASNRAKFIQSLQAVLYKLNLDGIDLDWEFPNNIWNNDKSHFIELLEDIRQNINNSVKKYILSVAVAAPITIVGVSYDIPSINRLVDFVNVMSYDYNFFSFLTPWTAMNAPLYARSEDISYFATQNINFTSHFWVTGGMSKEKINIGVPVYAHTYTLADPAKTYLGAPTIGNGKLGEDGSAKYGDICSFIQQQQLKPVFDEETKSPYVTNGTEWVSFDNERSLTVKAEYIYNNHYGGVMIFSLSSDDYAGTCKNGESFPNTKVIYKIFTQ